MCYLFIFIYVWFIYVYAVSDDSDLLIWWKRIGGRRSESCTRLFWQVPAVSMQGKSRQHTHTYFYCESFLSHFSSENNQPLTLGAEHSWFPCCSAGQLTKYSCCDSLWHDSLSHLLSLSTLTQFHWSDLSLSWKMAESCCSILHLEAKALHLSVYSSAPIIRYHIGPKLDSFPNYSKYLLLSAWCTRWVGCSLLGVIHLMTLFQAGPINHRKMIWSF